MPIKTQSALINPYTLPAPQNAAEEEFAKCMAAGIPYRIGKGRPEKPINKGRRPTTPEDREKDNVIRANVIRFFAWGGDEENPIRGNVIDLQGVWVTGALDLTGASIPYALIFTNCHFEQCVVLSYSELRLLELYGTRLVCGLAGKGMRVHNDILMNGPFLSESEISLLDANIGGNLYCEGTIKSKNRYAFAADGIKIGGNLSFEGDFLSEKETSLLDARIGGNLYCEGKMKNKDGYAFSADRIRVSGNLSFGGGFAAEGMVRLPAANIGKDLYCDNAKFNGEFNIKAATIKNRLVFQDIRGSGTVDLSFASVDILADEGEVWEKFHLNLDGFSYARFADEPAEVEARINWLKKWPERPGGKIDFSPQPFEQAARALFAMGCNNEAQSILLEKEKRLTQRMPRKQEFALSLKQPGRAWNYSVDWFKKQMRRAWNLLAGYGYRLRRTVILSGIVIVTGGGVFWCADQSRHIVPHQPVVVAHEKYQNPGMYMCDPTCRPTEVVECLFPEYPRFHALVYSVDVFIPFFALHQEPYWYPHPPKGEPIQWLFVLWYWFEIAAGWVLTSLLVLSSTGLLRPRQSSGDKE